MKHTVKIKSCSCAQCRRGRHNYRKAVERKARRLWNDTVRRISMLKDPEDSNLGFSFYGGPYTD